jgi:hypothetical protein
VNFSFSFCIYVRITAPFKGMGEGKIGDGVKDASTPTPRSKKGKVSNLKSQLGV